MPYIEDIAFPALAKSGYQPLFPHMEGAAFWSEELGLPRAPSAMASMFGEVLSLASEPGAMDQKLLGHENRPEEEIISLLGFEVAFTRRHKDLTQHLNASDPDLQSDAFEVIAHLRTVDVDFAAVAQAEIGGTSKNTSKTAGYASLLLMSAEIGDMSIDGQTVKLVHTNNSE
ncbi:hypothetical protein [Ancylobacter sp.]|uniref:hypothetical protein n=1 Tax=Ancylobacter sp. TaxID=1872567 RepID=UPI003C7E878A